MSDVIDAAGAWPVTKGAGVRVGVLDTGWGTPKVPLTPAAGHVLMAQDFTGSHHGTQDVADHGTDVAEIVRSVASEALLVVAKVHADAQAVSSQWVAAGLDWAVRQGVHVVNMSVDLGTIELSSFTELYDAIKAAVAKNVIITCAAGNTGGPTHYPARWPEVVSVGDVWDEHANGVLSLTDTSCRGPDLDAVAPGFGARGRYGTSFASPFVAGAAALYAAARGPGWSAAEFRTLLRQTGKLVGDVPLPQCGDLARAASARRQHP